EHWDRIRHTNLTWSFRPHNTPLDMVVRNGMSRYHRCLEALRARCQPLARGTTPALPRMLATHRRYLADDLAEHLENLPQGARLGGDRRELPPGQRAGVDDACRHPAQAAHPAGHLFQMAHGAGDNLQHEAVLAGHVVRLDDLRGSGE